MFVDRDSIEVTVSGRDVVELRQAARARAHEFWPGQSDEQFHVGAIHARPSVHEVINGQVGSVLQWEADVRVWLRP